MSEGGRQEGETVGDYRLVRKSSENERTRIWEAEQISMQRSVMLEILRGEFAGDENLVSEFLASVRAKALVTHPGVGAVYEAVSDQSATFFSRERLDGVSFEEMAQSGRKLTPLKAMVLLGQITAAMIYLEQSGVATEEYALSDFIIVAGEQARVMNLAFEGTRDPGIDTRAKALLGHFIAGVLKPGLPGETRVRSLCQYMTDLKRPVPLTWKQIEKLSGQVRSQLESPTQPVPPGPAVPSSGSSRRGKPSPATLVLLGGLGLIGALIYVMATSGDPPVEAESEALPEVPAVIVIPKGTFALSGGKEVKIRESFAISRTEVTLAEYQAFLKAPDHRSYAHPDQPEDKMDHRPDDWDALWSAAVKGETWRERPMSMECPVVGVDWWDAYAFANWRQGRLPGLSEWRVAATHEGAPGAPSRWGEVGSDPGDVTGTGLAGMAGSVREWTRLPEINPDDPLSPKGYVAAGGSFLKPEGGVKNRLWAESRSLRRSDLGFRVIVGK